MNFSNKKKFITIIPSLFFIIGYSQVGIGTKNPDLSSALHVEVNPSAVKGTILSRVTTAQRNSISQPAPGLIVYDMDAKCLMTNNGTKTAPIWKCASDNGNKGAFRHLFFDFFTDEMTLGDYRTTGIRPSENSTNNVVGYLKQYAPERLVDVPEMDGIRMNAVFLTKGANDALMAPILENVSGSTIPDFTLMDQSTVSGSKRVKYQSLNNNYYFNVDPDGQVYYDTDKFETAIAVVNHNGKMYRCTWWGYYDNDTHYIHMTMEVFN